MSRSAADIHVRIGRLVVDRAALTGSGVRGLGDVVSQRIAHRLEGANAPREDASGARADLSDAIAMAVAEQLSPRLDRVRSR